MLDQVYYFPQLQCCIIIRIFSEKPYAFQTYISLHAYCMKTGDKSVHAIWQKWRKMTNCIID